MEFELSLTKPGDELALFDLDLDKGDATIKASLSWEGAGDLDLHAFVATKYGDDPAVKAKITSRDDILSCYNAVRVIRGVAKGHLPLAADGTFSTHKGALVHSRDMEEGDSAEVDEWLCIYPDRLSPPEVGHIEIPLIVSIHNPKPGQGFRDIKKARVVIEDGEGTVLLTVALSGEFAGFTCVQMGTIMVNRDGSRFAPVGAGFNDNFNKVISFF